MRYGRIQGPIYCRFARTAPVINSELADAWGIEAALDQPPARGSAIEAGRSVKLRLVLDDLRQRLTCHARIDAIERDPATDSYRVRFGQLSLSEPEFLVLMGRTVDGQAGRVTFVDTVRSGGDDAIPVLTDEVETVPIRDKAVTMPVDLIERIDAQRGRTPFSEFVVDLLRRSLR